ncbi:MAG: phosphoribosylanthranilate isomerase [Bryobacteraceae bacterium]|nr:phosphoribosylanthranilate isomerase [Bryobacteraceae bacterium]
MIVKICGITNEEDALAAAVAGAAAVGFNFYPASPRYIRPAQAARIARALPASVWKVGVFVNAGAEQILRVCNEAGLDVAQLHGNESPDQLPSGIRLWKAFRAGHGWKQEEIERFSVEAVLLDSGGPDLYGGSGQTLAWEQLPRLKARVILAGGLDADNVREAIRAVRPWGVDACSRLEIRPGKKDLDEMIRFIRNALSEQES